MGRYRKISMSFRVTEEERDKIRRKADISQYGREKYLRNIAVNGYIYKQDLSHLNEFINAINKIGICINQIAHCKIWAHNIDHERLTEILEERILLLISGKR
jgi:hypothetical protein